MEDVGSNPIVVSVIFFDRRNLYATQTAKIFPEVHAKLSAPSTNILAGWEMLQPHLQRCHVLGAGEPLEDEKNNAER